MTWYAMLVLLYFGILVLVLLFFNAASRLNERADAWAEEIYEYLTDRDRRRHDWRSAA